MTTIQSSRFDAAVSSYLNARVEFTDTRTQQVHRMTRRHGVELNRQQPGRWKEGRPAVVVPAVAGPRQIRVVKGGVR